MKNRYYYNIILCTILNTYYAQTYDKRFHLSLYNLNHDIKQVGDLRGG